MRENHYAILTRSKISYVFTYKISITLLIFPKCRDGITPIQQQSYNFLRCKSIGLKNKFTADAS